MTLSQIAWAVKGLLRRMLRRVGYDIYRVGLPESNGRRFAASCAANAALLKRLGLTKPPTGGA